VFGRIGYNTNTGPELWQREFTQRFGKEAGPLLEDALHQASRILPRIVASCYPYSGFPMTRGWAEKQRLGDLKQYARAEGSDIQQFASFDAEAQMLLDGGETARIRPGRNSQWLARVAGQVTGLAAEAERRVGTQRGKEFESTVTDLKILANLALFHSRRIPAAVNYRLFERTKAPRALRDAIDHEQRALEAWRQLVIVAGDFYAEDLMMGVRTANLCGHWKDELVALEKGLIELQQQQDALPPGSALKDPPPFPPPSGTADTTPPEVRHEPIRSATVGLPITISAEVVDPAGVKWVRLRYRSVNQHQDYRTLPMVQSGAENTFAATIPAEDVVPAWDLMYFLETMDQAGNGRIYPDLETETPYLFIKLNR
jgi:hypothetical protein